MHARFPGQHIVKLVTTLIPCEMVRVFVVGVGMTKFEKPGAKVSHYALCTAFRGLQSAIVPPNRSNFHVSTDRPVTTRCWLACAQDWDYPDMARIAATRALKDACISYDEVQQVYARRRAIRCARVCVRCCEALLPFFGTAAVSATATATLPAANVLCTNWA